MLGLIQTCAPPRGSSSSPVRPCAPISVLPAQCASLSSLEANLFPHVHVRWFVGFSFGSLESLK